MGIFQSTAEAERKAKLKKLEDKRVAFAQRLAREGFAPERMLFAQSDNGGFVAVCREGGQACLIVSPGFGEDDGEFVLERCDALAYEKVDVHQKGDGVAGLLGFGKKGEDGVEFVITRANGAQARMPFVANRGSWLEAPLAKNPLLKTQRRRGDANVVWDFKPLDLRTVSHAIQVAEEYFKG